jgi:pentatricopeptide repeat protein
VSTADVDLLLRCSLEAGNVSLALSIYQQLRAAQRAQAAGGPAAPASTWPAATLQHTETLVKGLCRQLRVNDALAVLRSIRSHGVPGSEEVRQEYHSNSSNCKALLSHGAVPAMLCLAVSCPQAALGSKSPSGTSSGLETVKTPQNPVIPEPSDQGHPVSKQNLTESLHAFSACMQSWV